MVRPLTRWPADAHKAGLQWAACQLAWAKHDPSVYARHLGGLTHLIASLNLFRVVAFNVGLFFLFSWAVPTCIAFWAVPSLLPADSRVSKSSHSVPVRPRREPDDSHVDCEAIPWRVGIFRNPQCSMNCAARTSTDLSKREC